MNDENIVKKLSKDCQSLISTIKNKINQGCKITDEEVANIELFYQNAKNLKDIVSVYKRLDYECRK